LLPLAPVLLLVLVLLWAIHALAASVMLHQ
jgi:hypothetical protein